MKTDIRPSEAIGTAVAVDSGSELSKLAVPSAGRSGLGALRDGAAGVAAVLGAAIAGGAASAANPVSLPEPIPHVIKLGDGLKPPPLYRALPSQAFTLPLADAQVQYRQPRAPEQPAQTGNYFNFRLEGAPVVGRDTDPTVPGKVFDQSARVLDSVLTEGKGTLKIVRADGVTKLSPDAEKADFALKIGPRDERHAVDFCRTVTRDVMRERAIIKEAKGELKNVTDGDIKSSITHVLDLRLKHQAVPLAVTVLAADTEGGNEVFGGPTEMEFWNKTYKAHGMDGKVILVRNKEALIKAIIDTPPSKRPDGSLFFCAGFNGHGAEGGRGMSLASNGASNLHVTLTAADMASALEKHVEKHKELYEAAFKDRKVTDMGTLLFCCYSQDQARHKAALGADLLSRMEKILDTKGLAIRPFVLTVSETGNPGFYSGGPVRNGISVYGVRGLAGLAKKAEDGKLNMGHLFNSDYLYGGEGVLSNPTLYMSDRTRRVMFQIGQAPPLAPDPVTPRGRILTATAVVANRGHGSQ